MKNAFILCLAAMAHASVVLAGQSASRPYSRTFPAELNALSPFIIPNTGIPKAEQSAFFNDIFGEATSSHEEEDPIERCVKRFDPEKLSPPVVRHILAIYNNFDGGKKAGESLDYFVKDLCVRTDGDESVILDVINLVSAIVGPPGKAAFTAEAQPPALRLRGVCLAEQLCWSYNDESDPRSLKVRKCKFKKPFNRSWHDKECNEIVVEETLPANSGLPVTHYILASQALAKLADGSLTSLPQSEQATWAQKASDAIALLERTKKRDWPPSLLPEVEPPTEDDNKPTIEEAQPTKKRNFKNLFFFLSSSSSSDE